MCIQICQTFVNDFFQQFLTHNAMEHLYQIISYLKQMLIRLSSLEFILVIAGCFCMKEVKFLLLLLLLLRA